MKLEIWSHKQELVQCSGMPYQTVFMTLTKINQNITLCLTFFVYIENLYTRNPEILY